ncbi:MAG: hypothetical protein IJR13_07625 [Bacteroidales bacterium]|nr:hypothetical protein [Bacteroidales bacterium]
MKTTEEMIAVMQAFAEGKTIEIYVPDHKEWHELKSPSWDWAYNDYRVKPEKHLPATWIDFCETHPIKEEEGYIDLSSNINTFNKEHYRKVDEDKNVLPNKDCADALLALCQLIQLRDCYNNGWQPDWENGNQIKYAIIFVENEITIISSYRISHVLTFKTEELLHEFKKNFKYLIEQAKPLL